MQSDLIVSLGTNCAITYNLRHFYGLKETGLLDWVITPLASLPRLIQCGFELADNQFAGSLAHTPLGDTDGIMHLPTGIMIQHEFPRDWRRRISHRWRSEIGAVAEKYAFLGRRMHDRLNEAQYPAVFVYGTGWHQALSDELNDATHREDIYLQVIETFRDTYPNSDPTFYLLQGHPPSIERVKDRPDVRVAMVENYGHWHEDKKDHFAGCKNGWREAFEAVGLSAAPDDARRVRAIAR